MGFQSADQIVDVLLEVTVDEYGVIRHHSMLWGRQLQMLPPDEWGQMIPKVVMGLLLQVATLPAEEVRGNG